MDPFASLSTLISNNFLHSNVTGLSAIPPVIDSMDLSESGVAYILVLMEIEDPEYINKFKNVVHTLACVFVLNSNSFDLPTVRTTVVQTLNEISRVFNANNLNSDYDAYYKLKRNKDNRSNPQTFEFTVTIIKMGEDANI